MIWHNFTIIFINHPKYLVPLSLKIFSFFSSDLNKRDSKTLDFTVNREAYPPARKKKVKARTTYNIAIIIDAHLNAFY